MPTITIDYANGKKIPTVKALPVSLTFGPTDTIADVKKDINRHFPRVRNSMATRSSCRVY